MDPHPSDATAPAPIERRSLWLRRLGTAGFLFFLIKGLLWLLVPAALLAWQALTR